MGDNMMPCPESYIDYIQEYDVKKLIKEKDSIVRTLVNLEKDLGYKKDKYFDLEFVVDIKPSRELMYEMNIKYLIIVLDRLKNKFIEEQENKSTSEGKFSKLKKKVEKTKIIPTQTDWEESEYKMLDRAGKRYEELQK